MPHSSDNLIFPISEDFIFIKASLEDIAHFAASMDVSTGNNAILSVIPPTDSQLRTLVTMGLLEKTSWFLPNVTAIPPDLNLRLDSRLFLYAMKKENYSLLEVFAIKGIQKINTSTGVASVSLRWTPQVPPRRQVQILRRATRSYQAQSL